MTNITASCLFRFGFFDVMGRLPSEGADFFLEEMDNLLALEESEIYRLGMKRAFQIQSSGKPDIESLELAKLNTDRASRIDSAKN